MVASLAVFRTAGHVPLRARRSGAARLAQRPREDIWDAMARAHSAAPVLVVSTTRS